MDGKDFFEFDCKASWLPGSLHKAPLFKASLLTLIFQTILYEAFQIFQWGCTKKIPVLVSPSTIFYHFFSSRKMCTVTI